MNKIDSACDHSSSASQGGGFNPFFRPQDWSRLEYGRLLWKSPRTRDRLLVHWLDERHPHHERFASQWRPWVEKVLRANPEFDESLDRSLRSEGLSLRVVIREIPPVFGSFY